MTEHRAGTSAVSRHSFLGAGVLSAAGYRRVHGAAERVGGGFIDPLTCLAFCHERGAAGAQLALGVREAEYTGKLRRWLEERRLYVEGSLGTPRDRADLKRFEAEVRTAREAGATVVRTVML